MEEQSPATPVPADDEDRLHALLKPTSRRRFGPQSKSLDLAFTRPDEMALTRLLQAHFAGVVFAGSFDMEGGKEFRQTEGVHGPPRARERWAFVPPPGWDWDQVTWSPEGFVQGLPSTLVSYKSGTLDRDLDEAGRPREQVMTFASALWEHYYRDDGERKALLRRVWRLVDGISERDVRAIYDTRHVVDRIRLPGMRFGYDALQWCGQHPDRRLARYFRPVDDWVRPESPWYEGLRGL